MKQYKNYVIGISFLAINFVHFMIKIFFTTKYTKKHEDFFILIILRDLRG
jgi:hypothetical protein